MTRGWLGVTVLVVALGCGGSKKSKDDEENPVRDHRAPKADDPADAGSAKADGAPAPRSELTSVDITFTNGDRTIEGVLTLPSGDGPFPAVLVHAGSGPTDRDWNNPLMQGTNGSGKLLAEQLSAKGFAVLRFDKLGTGKTTAPSPLTWDAVLGDARAALEALRVHERVDRSKLFLAGHSEGGVHMIELARREKDAIAGLVLLASAGRAMRDVIAGQLRGQFETAGMNADEEMAPIEAAFDAFFAGKDVDPTTASKHVGVQQLLAQMFNPAAAAYARELYGFDPAVGVADVRVPILVWNGDKDIQVSPKDDAQRLFDAAKKAGAQVALHVSPDSDHVLKYEATPKNAVGLAQAATYNAADRDLDPDALNAIVDWLRTHSK